MAKSNTEVFVVVKDGCDLYYLLKVQRRGFDLYCFSPHLGAHYSLHESGEFHTTPDRMPEEGPEPPPVIVMSTVGVRNADGIWHTPFADNPDQAYSMFSAIYPIDSLSGDFTRFTRRPKELFVIDKDLFAKGTEWIMVDVWAVPDNNKLIFKYNNPDIPEGLMYKVADVEPQLWVYAKPCLS